MWSKKYFAQAAMKGYEDVLLSAANIPEKILTTEKNGL